MTLWGGFAVTGASRPAQAEVETRHEAASGLSKFDPDAVVAVLRDGLFYYYLQMCLRIEEVPPKLAAFGEQCPCHFAVASRLTGYRKQRLMSCHFGDGVTSCPAAGMMGPEIVSGRVLEHDCVLEVALFFSGLTCHRSPSRPDAPQGNLVFLIPRKFHQAPE